MKVEQIKTDILIPYEKNTKKHDKTQINNVAESIKQYGFVQPIVADKNNVVVIGHCRLLASKKLNIKEVPVVYVDELSDEQVRKLRIIDNKSNESLWDMEFLKEELEELDFDGFDIDFDLIEENDIDWADVEELDETTYEEPQKKQLECPNCKHIDIEAHFKKV